VAGAQASRLAALLSLPLHSLLQADAPSTHRWSTRSPPTLDTVRLLDYFAECRASRGETVLVASTVCDALALSLPRLQHCLVAAQCLGTHIGVVHRNGAPATLHPSSLLRLVPLAYAGDALSLVALADSAGRLPPRPTVAAQLGWDAGRTRLATREALAQGLVWLDVASNGEQVLWVMSVAAAAVAAG